MDIQVLLQMIFNVVGGLSIFLLGMHNMSSGMQAVAGDKLRQLIHAVTNNRFMALGIGFLVTAIIQSSSVTSVMVVGFVNAGLMTLTQALGVIMGANIGTTVTGWILVLNIGKYGLPVLGVFGLIYLFTKNEKVRYIGMMVMGIGMVFFGLELMKNGFKPIRSMPQFLELFSKFTPDSFSGLLLCAFIGAMVTAIVQSSSATVGITMSMATTGVINFETSVALVLGMNVGTTITAFLASLGATTNAKRAAYGHSIFNILGVIWLLPFFPLYLKILPIVAGGYPGTMVLVDGNETYPYIIKGIAIAHTAFNIINVIVFVPFIAYLAKLLKRLAPDKAYREQPKLTSLDVRLLNSPVMGIEQSRREIIHMGQNVNRMLECLFDIIKNNEIDEKLVKKVFHREEVLDTIQKEVSTFLVEILSSDISHDLVIEARAQIRMADEYESVSDYIADILKLFLKLKKADISLTDTKRKHILELHERVAAYFKLIDKAIESGNAGILPKATIEADAISHQYRECRSMHLQRITDNKTDPLLTVSFMNMINCYRRIRDHILNVAEALAGEK